MFGAKNTRRTPPSRATLLASRTGGAAGRNAHDTLQCLLFAVGVLPHALKARFGMGLKPGTFTHARPDYDANAETPEAAPSNIAVW